MVWSFRRTLRNFCKWCILMPSVGVVAFLIWWTSWELHDMLKFHIENDKVCDDLLKFCEFIWHRKCRYVSFFSSSFPVVAPVVSGTSPASSPRRRSAPTRPRRARQERTPPPRPSRRSSCARRSPLAARDSKHGKLTSFFHKKKLSFFSLILFNNVNFWTESQIWDSAEDPVAFCTTAKYTYTQSHIPIDIQGGLWLD